MTHPGTGYLVSGFEQTHDKCRCWCHSALDLFSSPEPEYDFSPPPEYLSSADRAFILDEPAHVRVGFSNETISGTGNAMDHGRNIPVSEPEYAGFFDDESNRYLHGTYINGSFQAVAPGIDIHEGPANKAGFSHWSRKELASGKCDTCGDKLADCECVE